MFVPKIPNRAHVVAVRVLLVLLLLALELGAALPRRLRSAAGHHSPRLLPGPAAATESAGGTSRGGAA